MQVDKELLQILTEQAKCFQEQVPVFRIRQRNATELHAEVLKTLRPFAGNALSKEFRYKQDRSGSMTRLLLPEGATLEYYHVSGYRAFDRHTEPFARIVAEDADKLDLASLKEGAGDLLEKYQLNPSGSLDSVELERLWQLKASGINSQGIKGATLVNRLVYAFRRSVAGLPVWGSASVYIKTAAEQQVDGFGMDWRPIHEAHIHKAFILDPKDGATRILEELQNCNPEKSITAKDFSVESFSLGYFSDNKRNFQSFMQPVWVAKFVSKGFSRMGHVIVVPATNTAYEPIARKVSPPPFNERRTTAGSQTCHSCAQGTT
jgi:hypothetical protein